MILAHNGSEDSHGSSSTCVCTEFIDSVCDGQNIRGCHSSSEWHCGFRGRSGRSPGLCHTNLSQHCICAEPYWKRWWQACAAGRGWGQEHAAGAGALRKITPTAPQGAAAALPTAVQLPPALALVVRGGRDDVRMRLQQAFLAQYSTDAHPVSKYASRAQDFRCTRCLNPKFCKKLAL